MNARPLDLSLFLQSVRQRVGVDFSAYRRSMIERRVRGRMMLLSISDPYEYLDRLDSDPLEAGRLISHLTIKLGWFFRNEAFYERMRELIPSIVLDRGGRTLRVWSAGCGRGEEPYSLAMLLSEILPPGESADWRILATDLDPATVGFAREGRYPGDTRSERSWDLVPPGRITRSARGDIVVSDELKQRIEFAVHDLTGGESPLSSPEFDLVVCRNTLIYFDAEGRSRAMRALVGSIAPAGLLCLGESEWLRPECASSFDVVDSKLRIYRNRPAAAGRGSPDRADVPAWRTFSSGRKAS